MAYVKRTCPHCINGYVMTGYGPKPCMYCKGSKELWVEVPDPVRTTSNYSGSSEGGSSSSDQNWGNDSDDYPYKPGFFGCLSTLLYLAGAAFLGYLFLMAISHQM